MEVYFIDENHRRLLQWIDRVRIPREHAACKIDDPSDQASIPMPELLESDPPVGSLEFNVWQKTRLLRL